MVFVKKYTVLIVINIGRILQAPVSAVNSYRYDAVVLSGRRVHPARITDVLIAKQALGITRLLGKLCSGDSLGVLFRL